MTYNARTVNCKLQRIDSCDLLIACRACEQETDAKKWGELHDKLERILDDFDRKNGYATFEK